MAGAVQDVSNDQSLASFQAIADISSTAEQAEAMIDSLSKSASGLARQASGDSGMSGRDGLKKAYRGHASMRS